MSVRRSFDIERLREELRPFFASRPEVLAAFVFGSTARGAAGPLSDLDLVLLNEAPPLLSHRVLRDGVLLHATNERALADFRFRALQTYLDTKPLREAQAAALRERLARGKFAKMG